MRILMLGWEFPPFISGGLGTACHGLTRALDRHGHEVLFVLPRPVDRSIESHVRLLSPAAPPTPSPVEVAATAAPPPEPAAEPPEQGEPPTVSTRPAPERAQDGRPTYRAAAPISGGLAHSWFLPLPAPFASPYGGGGPVGEERVRIVAAARRASGAPPLTPAEEALLREAEALESAGVWIPPGSEWDTGHHDGGADTHHTPAQGAGDHYRGDLIAEAERYARLVVRIARHERFDVVHAHDWLTFPAGMAAARASGRPLVVHVHATEFDRSGEHVNQRVYDIERRGMHAAVRTICVSEFTRRICEHRYAAAPARLRVVYNGVDTESAQPAPGARIEARDRIVLFLGRITMQKGPEYFIQAAKRVLEKMDGVKFVVAGSGDMTIRMIELAADLGIGHKVLFTGFLRGADVDRIYSMADLYVMPSVSEPFGIAPLEAMTRGTPVIISRQSGVSEVLTHALKVDFWDIDDMANKILAVLRRPALGATLREHGAMEARRLTWDDAARKCERVYRESIEEIRRA